MSQEKFISGYCRALDQSRMVELEYEKGRLLDVDCGYGNCVHEANCRIAKAIREALEA